MLRWISSVKASILVKRWRKLTSCFHYCCDHNMAKDLTGLQPVKSLTRASTRSQFLTTDVRLLWLAGHVATPSASQTVLVEAKGATTSTGDGTSAISNQNFTTAVQFQVQKIKWEDKKQRVGMKLFPANPPNTHTMHKVRVLPVNVKLFKVHLIKTHLTSQSPSFFWPCQDMTSYPFQMVWYYMIIWKTKICVKSRFHNTHLYENLFKFKQSIPGKQHQNVTFNMLSCKPKCERQCWTMVLSKGQFGQRSDAAKKTCLTLAVPMITIIIIIIIMIIISTLIIIIIIIIEIVNIIIIIIMIIITIIITHTHTNRLTHKHCHTLTPFTYERFCKASALRHKAWHTDKIQHRNLVHTKVQTTELEILPQWLTRRCCTNRHRQ